MILEKFSDSFDEDILLQTRLQNFLNLPLRFGLQYRRLLLEEHAHTIQRQDLQRLGTDDPVENQKELLGGNIPDEAVEDPGEDDAEGLDVQLLELHHYLLLGTEEQLLEEDAQR